MEGQLEEVTIKPGNNPKPAEKKEVTQNFFVIVEFGQSQGSLLDQFLQVVHHMHTKKGGCSFY
eukprot:scaffold15364_cov186-Alexandrium_tamarense.AAC.5